MEKIEQIPLRYGLATAGCIILYFLVVHFAGFALSFEIHIAEFLILGAGVFFATARYQRVMGARVTYFKSGLTGILTGFIAALAYGLFLFFYLMFADKVLMESFALGPNGSGLTPYSIGVLVLVLGTATGLLSSFIAINLVKTETF